MNRVLLIALVLVCFVSMQYVEGATAAKTKSIYGDHAPEEPLPETAQQAIVGTLTILLFVLMAMELTSPEVLFLIALIIVILCEILTIKEGLAGNPIPFLVLCC